MSIQLPVINAAANDTWQALIDKTNAIINTVANSVLTANTNANGATTTGNAFIIGTLGATIMVANTLRGGNVQSSANLTISSNALFTGSLIQLGSNVVINTSSVAIGANIIANASAVGVGNSTVNAIINSTALVFGPNATLTGTSLSIGNSTVNAVVNTTGVSISGAALPYANNKTEIALNGSAIGTATRINFSGSGAANVAATVDVGNSQINVIINSIISLGNGVGGQNTNILYNDSTNLSGSGSFTFNNTTNTVSISNTLLVGATMVINSSVIATGNSTVNTVANATTEVFSNSSVSTSYGLGGSNIGANVVFTLSSISIGNSSVNTVSNSTNITTANIQFLNQLSGGNVVVTGSQASIGNSTVNTVANSTTVSTTNLVMGSTITVGSNVTVNTSTYLVGNSTFSTLANSVLVQVTNATMTSTINSYGFTVGTSYLSANVLNVAGYGTFNSNVQISGSAATGLFTNSTAVAIRGFAGGANLYLQSASGGATFGYMNSSAIGWSLPTTMTSSLAVAGTTNLQGNVTVSATTALGNTTVNSSNVWTVGTLTNLNQLTNGPGYLTSINSGQVTGALGFTPYNATNPSGYISSVTQAAVQSAMWDGVSYHFDNFLTCTEHFAIPSVGGTPLLDFMDYTTVNWRMWGGGVGGGTFFLTAGVAGSGVQLGNGSTSWSAYSDRRIKVDFESVTVLDKLDNFRAGRYTNTMSGLKEIGVIAQEQVDAWPELVYQGTDDTDEPITNNMDPRLWSTSYDRYGVLALQGVKELRDQNIQLRKEVDALTKMIAQILKAANPTTK